MSNIDRKRRGNVYSKYATRSNLHVIKPQLPEPPISLKKGKVKKKVVEKADLLAENNESALKNSSLCQVNKIASVKKEDKVTTHKEPNSTKSEPIQQKKDASNKNQKSHHLSNFLALSRSVPTRQEKEVRNFKSNFLALQQVDKNVVKSKPASSKMVDYISSEGTVNKILNISASHKVCKSKASVKTDNLAGHDVKKKPDQAKKFGPLQKLGDPSFMPQHIQCKTTVKKKLLFNKLDSLQRVKESTYHESEFSTRKQEDKLKARPGSSKKFENPNKRDTTFFQNERSLPEGYLSYEKETELRKGPRSSRAYLSRDLEDKEKYYKSKYQKSKDKQKDYKWQERKNSSESDRYNWYSKEYDFTKKYHEVSHSSKTYSDFEELEDYEEVASIEDGSKDSKLPVHFRKCMVRYLPYTIYSYFRPKWYYLSRKRYVVNCLYASGREVKIDKSKLKVAKSGLEVPEVDFKGDNEILKGASDDEEMIEDVSVVNDNEETIEEVSVHESEETINDVSVHDNQETTEDGAVVHNSEEVTEDDTVVHDNNEEVTEDVGIGHEDNIKQDHEVLKVDLKPMESKKKIQNQNDENLTEKNLTNVASSPNKVQTLQNTKTSMTPKKKSTAEKGKMFPVTDLRSDNPLKSNDIDKNSETLKEDAKSIIKKREIEIINLDDEDDFLENSETDLNKADQMEQCNSKESANKSPRVFLKCISSLNFTSDFYQGDVAIQSSLREWKSHLIGLEYVLEIQDNTDKTIIKKYHCGLCNEDLPSTGQFVINHIISYDHMCNYVAKHFPSSDYKFSKSARSCINEIVLQTCCEEINHRLGYHYMCIVKEDYFQNEYDKIKEHFNAMNHWDESNMNIYPTIIVDELESDIHKDVVCIVEDMTNKIVAGEPKKTFFTPQTIVSSLRRSNVKDLLKINENTVNRSSQNTLIVLTPSISVTAVKTPSLPSAELKSPKKLVTSPPTPKTSKESHRIFNLLQVPVHDASPQHLQTDAQFSTTTSGCVFDKNATVNTSDKIALPQRNPPDEEEENLSAEAINNPNLKVSDIESTFNFGAKKAGSFRKYKISRFQDGALVPSPVIEQSEKDSAVRIVRIRTPHSRPIPLESDSDEEDQGESVDISVHLKEDATIAENNSSSEDNDNTGAADNLQGEDISDNDFSELDFVEVVSPGVDKTTPRSRSHSKQQHRKALHSKYCHKRATWIKGSSSDKESSLKDVNLSGSAIPTIGKTIKKYSSNFMKKADEYSEDSYASSTSKRKRSPRSSSSPSLEEFLRKLSPSPVRKRSKSPLRPYSTYKKRDSMIRRHSRSPYRRYSRSPNSKHSRSPYRKRSRSPIRRRSRSPYRRRSRSPNRKRSRSPIRKRSRSPIRKRSRSPHRRHSRSPYRRHSRSPHRRSSRSPIRRSKSPLWSVSKGQSKRKSSPFRKVGGYKVSRSPEKAPIKLPSHKYSKSPTRRPTSPLSTRTRPKSPIRSDSRIPEDSLRYKSESLYKHSKDSHRSSGSYESTSKLSLPHRHPETELIKDELDDVSDEDESKYFNTSETPKYMEIIKNLPESARIMLVKVLQRFSITNINPNDPSFYELMKFVASHSSEIQRLMSQPSVLPEVSAPVQGNPTVQSQESFLHQYILTGMKGNLSLPSEAMPSTSSIFPGSAGINFQQTPGPSTSGLQFHSSRSNLPLNQFAQSVFQQPSTQPPYPVQSIHTTPPKVAPQQVFMNAPSTQQQPRFQPDVYRPVSPPKQAIPLQPKVTSEVMFKDLKAAVSKIFGGDDALAKLGIKIPGLGGTPANEKYSANPSNVPQINPDGNQSGQINPEPQTSFHGKRSGLDIQNAAPTRINDNLLNLKSYPKEDEAYFHEAPRQGLHVPPPDAKVSFCDVQRTSSQRNLFPVVNSPERTPNYRHENSQISVNDAKKSLAQRLAAVLVKVGMTDVPAHLLQEMLMKIGAFSLNPPQDISEGEILGILRKLKYL